MTKNSLLFCLLLAIISGCNLKISENRVKVFEDKTVLSEEEDKEFERSNKEVCGGSSPSIQYFLHKPTQTNWIGKCSELAIFSQKENGQPALPDYINEYKECLAIKLYSHFGVQTPEVVLSRQIVSQKAQDTFGWMIEEGIQHFPRTRNTIPNIAAPRYHIMSRFIDGFYVLGENFLTSYPQSEEIFRIKGTSLKGFGTTLAVATFLYDYDCVGNSGGNIGYIIEDGCANVVKIDAGEALPFVSDLSNAQGIKHHPKSRDMIIGTGGTRVSFADLNRYDQKEFALTAKQILSTSDETLENIFKEFITLDKRFCKVLSLLIDRKSKFLSAFSPEVRELLVKQMHEIEKDAAEKLHEDWNAKINLSKVKGSVIGQGAKLDAYKLVDNPNKFQIPDRNENFVGRQEELKTIDTILEKDKVICICGAGGLGKTQLVAQYIAESKYEKVIWLHAEHGLAYSQIQTYMHTLYPASKEIKYEELLEFFYEKIGNSACIVFDNVENEDSIKDLVPKKLRAHIIITSRYKNWNGSQIALGITKRQMLDLNIFSVKDLLSYADRFFVGKLKISAAEAEELHTLLGGLPLAITQAFAYIKQNGAMTVADYCKNFKENQDKMIKSEDPELSTISTTLTLALHEIKRKDPMVDEVMNIAAYLSSDHITLELLESFNKKKLAKPAQLLLDYSIFVTASDKTLKIHRLTQAVMRMIHRKLNCFEKNFEEVADWLLSRLDFNVNSIRAYCNIDSLELLIPHALFICQTEDIESKDWERLSSMSFCVGSYYISRLNFSKAVRCYERAYNLLMKNNPNHNLLFYTISHLTSIYGELGDYKRQKKISDMLISMIDRQDISEKTKQRVLVDISTAYKNIGNYAKAMDFLIAAQNFFKDPKSYEELLALGLFLINFGSLYGSLGNLEKCKEVSEAALLILEKCYSLDERLNGLESTIGGLLTNLGNVCGELGEYEQAEKYLQGGLKLFHMNDKIHNIPNIAMSYQILGKIFFKKGEYEKSITMLLKSIMMCILSYGRAHTKVADNLIDLGRSYSKIGLIKKSEKVLLMAMQIYMADDSLDPNHNFSVISSITRALNENSRSKMTDSSFNFENEDVVFQFFEHSDNKLSIEAGLAEDFEENPYAKNLEQIQPNRISKVEADPERVFYQATGSSSILMINNKNSPDNHRLRGNNESDMIINENEINFFPKHDKGNVKSSTIVENSLDKLNENPKIIPCTKCFRNFEGLDEKSKNALSKKIKDANQIWNSQNDENRYAMLKGNELLNISYEFLKLEFKQYLSETTQNARYALIKNGKRMSTEEFWYGNVKMHLDFITSMNAVQLNDISLKLDENNFEVNNSIDAPGINKKEEDYKKELKHEEVLKPMEYLNQLKSELVILNFEKKEEPIEEVQERKAGKRGCCLDCCEVY
jgi:tetratricopeptide (TPR) repeat protein